MSFIRTVSTAFGGWTIMLCSLNRRAARALCCMLMLGLISAIIAACSDSSRPSKVSSTGTTQTALSPISAVPPGSQDRPLLPGQSGTEYMPNGLPALSPSRGVNADQLFAEKLKDEKARFDRLERAVADMRREFDAIKPAIVRLTAVESDMQDLIGQLQTLTGAVPANQAGFADIPDLDMEPLSQAAAADLAANDITQPDAPVMDTPIPSPPSAAPLQPEPAAITAHSPVPQSTAPPAAAVTTTPTPAAVADDGALAVTGIRSGNHDGVARLVLDVSGTGAYTLDLDNTEHVLMIELPGTAWRAATQGSFSKSPLLTSWSSQASGKGSLVAVQLSGKATIVKQSVFPAATGKGSRIVIDLQ